MKILSWILINEAFSYFISFLISSPFIVILFTFHCNNLDLAIIEPCRLEIKNNFLVRLISFILTSLFFHNSCSTTYENSTTDRSNLIIVNFSLFLDCLMPPLFLNTLVGMSGSTIILNFLKHSQPFKFTLLDNASNLNG